MRAPQPAAAARRGGMALVEVVVSALVVSLLLLASLQAVASSRLRQWRAADRARGLKLAEDLLNEALCQAYVDPGASPVFGLEAGESSASGRGGFDDVDDYHNYTESPPKERDGTALTDLAGWQRGVAVARVNPLDLNQVVASDGGVKRIIVTVKHNSVPAAVLVAYRSAAWPVAQER